MENVEETIEILNDLVRMNNDRVEGYEKAIEDTRNEDFDLKELFAKLANDSRVYIHDLTVQITALDGEEDRDTTASGKIYRMWMDIKAAFSGKSALSVLESCEFGEDAIQKAYREALEDGRDLPLHIRELILNQKDALLQSHNLVKQYRDVEKATD